MGREKTADELKARAKANGYKRGAHREEYSHRDCNKHMDDTMKDQDGALDRYIVRECYLRPKTIDTDMKFSAGTTKG